jgi:hypothetical protein
MKTMYKDFPFDEVCDTARRLAVEGHKVYQKFTCVGCGQRLTMDEPNHFYEEGTCDKCDAVTDIKKQGCNYMVVSGGPK